MADNDSSKQDMDTYNTSAYNTSAYKISAYDTSVYKISANNISDYNARASITSDYDANAYDTSAYDISAYNTSAYDTSAYATSESATTENDISGLTGFDNIIWIMFILSLVAFVYGLTSWSIVKKYTDILETMSFLTLWLQVYYVRLCTFFRVLFGFVIFKSCVFYLYIYLCMPHLHLTFGNSFCAIFFM